MLLCKHWYQEKTIARRLDEDFIFPDFDTDKELLWTLLTFSGYLTQAGETEQRTIYNLRVPNYEIKTVFQDIIMKWLLNEVNVQRSWYILLRSTWLTIASLSLKRASARSWAIHLAILIRQAIRKRCIRHMCWACCRYWRSLCDPLEPRKRHRQIRHHAIAARQNAQWSGNGIETDKT